MEISHSSGGWKSVIRVLAYGVSVSSRWQKIPFSYLHMRKVSQYFFFFPLEVLIPSMRAPPSWLNYLPKFYVQISSQWGLDFNRWIGSGGWWGERTTDISVPNSPKFFLFLKKKIFIWQFQVLISTRGIFVLVCEIWFPDQGPNSGPLH